MNQPTEREDHDPFDPDYVRNRRTTGPRLVDLTSPLPEPEPAPAVPRPYAPQVRVKPEAIVPPSDNPMHGWRWLGARLLSGDLWPRDAVTNPVMAYFTGRQRGRASEDLLGVAPWALWVLFDFWFMFAFAKSYSQIFSLGLAEFVVAGVVALLWSATVTAMHLRRTMRNLPLEEMLLTRLNHIDIVQGLSIRPIAVQSASILYWSLASAIFALAADYAISGGIGQSALVIGTIVAIVRWYYLSVAIEIGGSIAMRAHLCIRQPLTACLRMLLDTGIVVAMFLLSCGLLAGVLSLISHVMKKTGATGLGLVIGFLSFGALALLVILLFAGVSFLFAAMRNMGSEAMNWCYNYPGEWWIKRAEGEERGEEARTLLTPWRPLGKDKVIYKASAPMNRK